MSKRIFLGGEATSYRYTSPPGTDGDRSVEPPDGVLVRHPVDPEDLNGTVVVEWT